MRKIVGQTLFLGATVVSYSSNIGWGGNGSSLTVELIEDTQPFGRVPFRKFNQDKSADYAEIISQNTNPLPSGHPGSRVLGKNFYDIAQYNSSNKYPDNHYYICEGDDCYIDELGIPYSESATKKEKNVPGKIYYEWVDNKFVSKYWMYEDPGFFAVGTKVQPDGRILNNANLNILNDNGGFWTYDIINTPVYFKFDNFEFIGLVKSWERNNKPGGITYSVVIESFDSLLNNCQVILDRYGGAIFGRQGTNKGTPTNDINIEAFDYTALLSEGSIPNIFNVYGFLESFGVDFFGGANYNDQGISGNDVIRGLSALTSSHNRLNRDAAFSPYGRILTKTIADIYGNTVPQIMTFGVISPSVGTNRHVVDNIPPGNYNTFSLDISDIGNLLPDYRVNGSQSISDLLRTFSEVTGTDYITRVIPAVNGDDGLYQFVIKVISVDRKQHKSPYSIRSIVTNLENQSYNISNSSFGQENNDNITHKFIIGGPQQRLLQVKNYRLPYNQTHYVYNPILKKFISLNKPENKMRVPSIISTRNAIISNLLFGPYIGDRININDLDRDIRFFTLDDDWRDKEVTYNTIDAENLIQGNYNKNITSLSEYKSYIITSRNLNKDTKERRRQPDEPCQYNTAAYDAMDDAGKDEYYIDDTCVYFTPQDCPMKTVGTPKCSEEPDKEGGKGPEWDENPPNKDKYPDLTDGGFVPVTGYDQPASRYLNLQNDFISPYFGRALEEKMPVADDTNEYRAVRPVFLDIWTNQIVVSFNLHELPQLSIGEPLSLYDMSVFKNQSNYEVMTGGLQRGTATNTTSKTSPTAQGANPGGDSAFSAAWQPTVVDPQRSYSYSKPGFVITESEMRACLANSFDSYFAYCLGKSRFSKPDLFLMLLAAYQSSASIYANLNDYGSNIAVSGLNDGLHRGPAANIGNRNVSFNGITTNPSNIPATNLQMNWNAFLNHNFIKDLQIIYEFIKSIADKYYGKKYLVKLPDMILYRDRQYSNIRIPGRFDDISVYAGSSKIFQNYELAEGAWEEPGNFIDDCMVIGDNFVKTLMDDNNLISPIAGYNNSLNIDDVRKKWCELDLQKKLQTLFNGADSYVQQVVQQLSAQMDKIMELIRAALAEKYKDSEESKQKKAEVADALQKIFNDILDSQAAKIFQNLALKELQQFGLTINCVPAATKRMIFDSWNQMISSINSTVKDFINDPSRVKLKKLPAQWIEIITTTQQDIQNNLVLIDLGVPSLDISDLGGSEDYVIVPVSPKTEPFGRMSPRSSKLFTKCQSERIVFMNLTNFTDPRAIMTVNKLDIFDSSLAYSKDPSLSIIANIAIEDSAIYIRVKNRLNELRNERNEALLSKDDTKAKEILEEIKILKQEVDYIRMLKSYIVPEIQDLDKRYLVTTGGSANPSVHHAMMAPRAAHPYFFGIPLRSKQVCYGPWTNYADNIIPQPYINNLIHKSDIDYNEDLVPWNYGSTSLLDKAVAYLLNTDINYQTILENGRVSIVGPPIFGLGGIFNEDPSRKIANTFVFDNSRYRLYYSAYKFLDTKRNGYRELTYNCIKIINRDVGIDGPLISNIGVQFGSEGVTTTYSFQTYNPKTGLYNKTYSDAMQQIHKDRSRLEKAINNLNTSLTAKIIREQVGMLEKASEDRVPTSTAKYKSALYGQSPVEIFVGQGVESLKNPSWYNNLNGITIKDSGDYPLPLQPKNEQNIATFLNQKRNYSWVGGVMGMEIMAELSQDYNTKSAMSMDGLLSPVSLYPTKANRTYSISTYAAGSGIPLGNQNTDTACPLCDNAKQIKISHIDYHSEALEEVSATDIFIPCPVCTRAKIFVDKKDKNPDKPNGLPDINLYSLNPIVLSSGEFRNPYASGLDRCRHSIAVVSRGEYNPIDTSLYINDNINTYVDGHNPDFARFDTKIQKLQNKNVLLNQRFMALRGPLMLHGWGFDTEGYPVPNALDMPYKLDEYGRPLRFQIYTAYTTDEDKKKFGFNDLDKPGLFVMGDSEDGIQHPLGDIVTNRYEWKGKDKEDGSDLTHSGRWIKKNKSSKQFYLNWAERQDTWPVGPIDLRWDEKRKVWDASGGGCKQEIIPPFIVSNKNDISTLNEFLSNRTDSKCPYKMVYITLEQDMTKEDRFESTNPARGFIDDLEYSKEPLQNDYRRLVYVIDVTGYTAPKGAKLLCRYNRDNGFYEPVTKPVLTAFGTIDNNQAKIELSYIIGRRSGVVPVSVVTYANPFNIQVFDKGLFNYINGKWTLVAG